MNLNLKAQALGFSIKYPNAKIYIVKPPLTKINVFILFFQMLVLALNYVYPFPLSTLCSPMMFLNLPTRVKIMMSQNKVHLNSHLFVQAMKA